MTESIAGNKFRMTRFTSANKISPMLPIILETATFSTPNRHRVVYEDDKIDEMPRHTEIPIMERCSTAITEYIIYEDAYTEESFNAMIVYLLIVGILVCFLLVVTLIQ